MRCSKEEAIQQAWHEVGLKIPKNLSAKRVILESEVIPFLAKCLVGKTTWKVEMHNLDTTMSQFRAEPGQIGRAQQSQPTGPGGIGIPHISSVSITLAPDTGHVLSAISPWPEGIPQIAPFPPASEEERQLVNRGERFTGLPAFAPSISLLKALQIIEAEAPGGANQARQIIAYYIMQETVRYRERAVWIVQTRGIPPFPTGFDAPVDIPEDARNHLRHTVDAQTGEWLSSDTTPQPVRSRKLSQILNPVLS